MLRYKLSWVAGALLAGSVCIHAQPVSPALTYQAELRAAGVPATGPVDLRFRLYDAANFGGQVGAQIDRPNVALAQGRFTQDLDFGAAAFGANSRWLEIEVRSPAGSGSYVTLTPRQRVTAAPVAQFALNGNPGPTGSQGVQGATGVQGQQGNAGASGAPGAPGGTGGTGPQGSQGATGIQGATGGTGASPFTLNGTSAVYTAGNVGIGTAGPNWPLHVMTDQLIAIRAESTATTGQTTTGYFATASNIGNALFASATAPTGSASGLRAYSSGPTGAGVFGRALSSTGGNSGVYGTSDSMHGRGVYGDATAASGATYGVHGLSNSPDGTGVYGEATAATGQNYGGHFKSASTDGRAVYGQASTPTGITYGGYFLSASEGGRGVFGSATALSGGINSYGGRFVSASSSGIGVSGEAAALSGVNYGVFGLTNSNASGWGVYSFGRFGASGTKAFRIDHPDDPANRYLLHYAAESPEVINFYSGKTTLDSAGGAVVELPHYFAKINRDPRYQLTAVGAPMPMLHVALEISEDALAEGENAGPDDAVPPCSFRIAGGAPGAKVSWRVEAVRNDRWVQQHGAPVEVEKQGLEKGTYQHPELYGQPQEKGMNWSGRETARETDTSRSNRP